VVSLKTPFYDLKDLPKDFVHEVACAFSEPWPFSKSKGAPTDFDSLEFKLEEDPCGPNSISDGNGGCRPSESAEHKFARQRLAQAHNRRTQLLMDLQTIQDEVHRLQQTMSDLGRQRALLDQFKSLQPLDLAAKREVEQAELQLAHADDCAKIFHDTADSRVSDLTVRQTEQVKACQSLNLYPPEK
jgi:hypothetical protein